MLNRKEIRVLRVVRQLVHMGSEELCLAEDTTDAWGRRESVGWYISRRWPPAAIPDTDHYM